MNYSALYRTYRPKTFDEVVGQEQIIQTLKNQIENNKVGHAYLFNGTRGTGKTSIAKIFSRAINCENPKNGEPCNECKVCKMALSGDLTDIVEMDAASNNSVDDIRRIIEELNFLPTLAKYRVYIIDEVHMLSTSAFNALLKTLEEPPEHVKFILATTEVHKIPATILSRCQRYDFKKISIENISKRLELVCKEQNVKYSINSLNLIASLSDGALRDGLSILDRVIQSSTDIEDIQNLRDLIRIPSNIQIAELIDSILKQDIDEMLKKVKQILDNGKESEKVVWEIIKYLRDILVYQSSKNLEIYSKEELEKMEELAKFPKEKIINLIFDFSSLEANLKTTSQKQIVFEAGLICITQGKLQNMQTTGEQTNQINPNIELRLRKVENFLNNLSQNVTVKQKEVIDTTQKQDEVNIPVDKNKYWDEFLNSLKNTGKMTLFSSLNGGTSKLINDNLVGIYFNGEIPTFTKNLIGKPENIDLIQNIFSKIFEHKMKFKIIENIQTTSLSNLNPAKELEIIAKENNVNFKIED